MTNQNYLPETNVSSLPSAFLQYPKGVVVKFRPFTFGDISKFNNSNMTDRQYYDFVLEGIDVSGMDKYDLTYYDTVYLALLRKRNSLGTTKVSMMSVCKHCETINTRTLDTSIFNEFEDLEQDDMPLVVSLNSGDLEFKFITIKDWLELNEEDKLKDPIAVYAKSIVNKDFQEAYDTVYNSIGEDMSTLTGVDQMLYHGLKLVNVVCDKCLGNYNTSLSPDDISSVIRPFRDETEPSGCKIRFGKKKDS